MPSFLRNFSLDRLSFWIGFLTGILLTWFLGKLFPILRQAFTGVRRKIKEAQEGLQTSVEIHHRNDTFQQAQRAHLAAMLFSLDEILVEPRVLAPPAVIRPNDDHIPDDVASLTLPYTPDWPEFAAIYHAPSFTLPQALSNGANLAIIGSPGIGKTVTLAHLASLAARNEFQTGDLSGRIPVFVHATEIAPRGDPQDETSQTAFEALVDAVCAKASLLTLARLPNLLQVAFKEGRILFLLDGLDELPPSALDRYVIFLDKLLQEYPQTRAVVAVSTDYFGGLLRLGFVPVALSTWDERQRMGFLKKWQGLWKQHVVIHAQMSQVDPEEHIVGGWLANDNSSLTPLEFTLKVWAAITGDTLGPGVSDGVEAYVRRMTAGITGSRSALDTFAMEMTASLRASVTRKEAEDYFSQNEPQTTPSTEPVSPVTDQPSSPTAATDQARTRLVPALLDNGLLISRANSGLAFSHPVIQTYLAACGLAHAGGIHILDNQPVWLGKTQAHLFLSSMMDVSHLAEGYLARQTTASDPLLQQTLTVARWVRAAPKSVPWRATAFRQMVSILNNETLSLGLRVRILTALTTSDETGLLNLFRQMLASEYNNVRILGVLGCGLINDPQAVSDLSSMVYDPVPAIQRAACLALGAIGTRAALEALASYLLQGNEDLRRAVAEVMAANPEEGPALFEEGSTMEDLLVRRAVVFGLALVKEPWAIKQLEKMAIEDEQWVVRNAAQHALEDAARPDPRLPSPPQPLSETAWLIAFAGNRGFGIAPGKPALDLLIQALKEGSEEQKLAALHDICFHGGAEGIPQIYALLYGSKGELCEAAYNALWHIAASGIPLPAPAQFSLG